jgi:hypothetical protein
VALRSFTRCPRPPRPMNELFQKIKDRTAHVGVIGQGYAGLPLAHRTYRR